MSSKLIIIGGILFIMGLLSGYVLYWTTDNMECDLDKSDLQNCINQSNELLDIVINKDNCFIKNYELGFNFTDVNIDWNYSGVD